MLDDYLESLRFRMVSVSALETLKFRHKHSSRLRTSSGDVVSGISLWLTMSQQETLALRWVWSFCTGAPPMLDAMSIEGNFGLRDAFGVCLSELATLGELCNVVNSLSWRRYALAASREVV